MSFRPIESNYSPPSSPYYMVPEGQSLLLSRSRAASLDEDFEAEEIYHEIVEQIIQKSMVVWECYASVSFSCAELSFHSQWHISPEDSYQKGGFYYAVFRKTTQTAANFYLDTLSGLRSRIDVFVKNSNTELVYRSNTRWQKDSSVLLISQSGKIFLDVKPYDSFDFDSSISLDRDEEKHSLTEDDFLESQSLNPDCIYEISSIRYRTILNL
jgi:hypothetical protein